MKTYKEYPATHSMSTAWYIVDEDGNVGIMDFDDNGPVPFGIGEHSIDELVFGVDSSKGDDYLPVKLTDDQIYEILGKPCSADEIWWSVCVIQIYPERTDEFLSIIKDDDQFIEKCISKDLGLYLIDAVCYVSDDNKINRNSILENIFERGIIRHIYKEPDFDISDYFDNGTLIFKKNFESLPYYIYKQAYWSQYMQELLVVPKQPVKFSQLPSRLQNNVVRIPIKFKDTKFLQIARWVSCNDQIYATVEAYGCGYTLLPIQSNQEAYCLNNILLSVPKPHTICPSENVQLNCKPFCQFPTVLAFLGPIWDFDCNLYNDYSEITTKSLYTQYLPFSLVKKTDDYLSYEDKKAIVKDSPIKEIFRNNVYVFEYIVNRFKPHLILIDDNEFEIISSVYPIENHEMNISGCKYPVYATSEVDDNRDYLTELAKLPYRGFRYPLVISIDEMKKINPDLKIPSHD